MYLSVKRMMEVGDEVEAGEVFGMIGRVVPNV